MPFNLAAIRQLVFVALDDDELKDLCFDHFPDVSAEFTAGQSKSERVRSLVSYADRHGRLDVLLDALEQANPNQFARFEADLRAGGGAMAFPAFDLRPFEPVTIPIPAGPFLMGSDDPAAPAAEQPQRLIHLPDFRIGKHPVTVRQYAAFIKDRKSHPAPAGWFNREPPADRLEHPATDVSWFDALAYCAWLSEQTGRRYILPSEAEWEKACSNGFSRAANNATAEAVTTNKYPWGEEWIEGRCNAASGGTTAVTAHPDGASAYGVEDLLGNVQEWTRSLWGLRPGQPDYGYPYDPADGREVTDPQKLPAQARLAHRGGSFKSRPEDLRVTARGNALPESKIAWRGFRVVMIMA
jgi:formylglycine-generating enzyme required for sulfatase activity